MTNNYNTPEALVMIKHKNKMTNIGIIFISIISIAIISMMFLKIVDQREKEIRQNNLIAKLTNDKNNLERNNRQLKHNNKVLKKNIRVEKNNRTKRNNSYSKPRTREQKKKPRTREQEKKSNKKTTTYQYNTRRNKPTKTYNTPQKHNEPTSRKKYQNFSKYIKLVSDSRIIRRNDNRLKSNAPIYGKFIPQTYSVVHAGKNQISNIRCNLKQNLYKIVDECSMTISNSFDKVYLGEMDSKDIKEFDRDTHMIECQYSQKHGIMHNCKKKIYNFFIKK